MNFTGGCHCGRIEIDFETAIEPSQMDVRACQCGFCRKHNSLAVSDPNGQIVIRIAGAEAQSSYEFGLRTAAYIVCGRCGVYVAAATLQAPRRAIVVLSSLRNRERFAQPARPVYYDNENREERLARRQRTWTPATIALVA
ncbi:MAG: hypothetical protein WD711_03810 [Dongiaceae bacterium]